MSKFIYHPEVEIVIEEKKVLVSDKEKRVKDVLRIDRNSPQGISFESLKNNNFPLRTDLVMLAVSLKRPVPPIKEKEQRRLMHEWRYELQHKISPDSEDSKSRGGRDSPL